LPPPEYGGFDLGGLPPDERQVGFIDLQNPNPRQIDDSKEVLRRIDKCAMVVRGSIHHDSCHGGVDRNRALHLSLRFKPLNLLIRDIPESKTLPRCGDKVFRTLGRGGHGARPQELPRFQRKQKSCSVATRSGL
jgi:hypothetical protein